MVLWSVAVCLFELFAPCSCPPVRAAAAGVIRLKLGGVHGPDRPGERQDVVGLLGVARKDYSNDQPQQNNNTVIN